MKIKHLKLDCANLEEQKYFYTRKFKFKVVEESKEELTLEIGNSLLTFSENRLKKPYYHFAFNIPIKSLSKALAWVKKKVEVLTTGEGEIQDFSSWEAKSIYFLDPAGNVVELIGRKRFGEAKGGNFNESSILNISEIGLPVFQVSSAFNSIEKVSRIKKFDCDSGVFCACGDHEGLFIIVDLAEKTWFPTDEPAREYPIEVNFNTDEGGFNLQLDAGGMTVNSLKEKAKS